MKTKSETIAEIMQLNPTVGAAFLSEFNNEDLKSYLRRLRELRKSKSMDAHHWWAPSKAQVGVAFQTT